MALTDQLSKSKDPHHRVGGYIKKLPIGLGSFIGGDGSIHKSDRNENSSDSNNKGTRTSPPQARALIGDNVNNAATKDIKTPVIELPDNIPIDDINFDVYQKDSSYQLQDDPTILSINDIGAKPKNIQQQQQHHHHQEKNDPLNIKPSLKTDIFTPRNRETDNIKEAVADNIPPVTESSPDDINVFTVQERRHISNCLNGTDPDKSVSSMMNGECFLKNKDSQRVPMQRGFTFNDGTYVIFNFYDSKGAFIAEKYRRLESLIVELQKKNNTLMKSLDVISSTKERKYYH